MYYIFNYALFAKMKEAVMRVKDLEIWQELDDAVESRF